MVYIIAIDPGGTTGWAARTATGQFLHGVMTGDHHLELWRFLNQAEPDILIWEAFNYQRRELDKGVSIVLVSKEYVGICRLWVQSTDAQGITVRGFEQQPGQKDFWHDKSLKRLLPLLQLSRMPSTQHEKDCRYRSMKSATG